MNSWVALKRTRRATLWTVANISMAILLLFIYQTPKFQDVLFAIPAHLSSKFGADNPKPYNDSTQPIFPSIVESNSDASDLCSNFPQEWLERVQVVLKTGVGQSAKTEAHLTSITSCIRNLIVFSDFPEQIAGHDFIDILATLRAPYLGDPDFAAYYAQKNAYASGKVEPSKDGWKLDRFKFLPMVDAAYEMRPNASWYVFLEADVYIFWDNLFRLLNQFDSQAMHYFGAAVAGSYGRWFAYGGAGIVLSQGLMKSLVGDGMRLDERYSEWALDDCCGDAVLAYAILDKTGVKLEDLYPMFSGEYLKDLEINKERWCVPLISLHRMSEDSLKSLWQWDRTRPASKRPIVHSDMLGFRQPDLRNTSLHKFWDNLSANLLPSDHAGSRSSLACADACEDDETCLQYSYTRNECRISPSIIHGHEVDNKDVEFTSGWNRRKMRELGLNLNGHVESGCEAGTWTQPKIH